MKLVTGTDISVTAVVTDAEVVVTTSDVVGTIATLGETLESLGSSLGYTDIDTMPASLDSRLFIGGKFLFSGAKLGKIVIRLCIFF